jgi:hypothetical protein
VNGFITLTTAGIVEAEADFKVDQIAEYLPNPQNPNGGSVITMTFGTSTAVMETVAQIRDLITQETAK